jgi:hypothetical protein
MTLPDTDMPRKPEGRAKRRWLFGPYLLLLLLVIAWSSGWVYLKLASMRQLDQSAQALRDAGYQVGWASADFRGYPFRLEVTLTDARIAEPSGWAITTPHLHAEAAIYQLGRWTAVADDGVTLSRPEGGTVAVRGELIRASVDDLDKTPPNIVIEGRKLTFTPQAGGAPYPLSTAERLDINLRPGPNDQAALLFRVQNAGAHFSGLLGRIAQDRPVSANWESILSHVGAFKGPNWPAAVQAWTAGGGTARVTKAGLTAGDALIDTTAGDLTVDATGRLRGALQVELREAAPSLMPDKAQATVTFDGGQTTLGPIGVGPAPRVY